MILFILSDVCKCIMICTILEWWTHHLTSQRRIPNHRYTRTCRKCFCRQEGHRRELAANYHLLYRNEYVSSLIGPEGKTIQTLIKTHEVNIIVIVNQRECESALEVLQSMIKGWKSTKYCVEKLIIPADLFGYVPGNHYWDVKRINFKYNVQVGLP